MKIIESQKLHKKIMIVFLLLCGFNLGCKTDTEKNTINQDPLKKYSRQMEQHQFSIQKSPSQWRKILTTEQYHVLREQGTERAFTGKYDGHKEIGTYYCAGCGQKLFSSEHKFDSGSGWPSYYQPIRQSLVGETSDTSMGMTRREVHCSRCGGHLGHIFADGPRPTGLRYCINSVSMNFKKKK